MPVTIRHEDENRLVIWEFQGNWTWEDYYRHRDEVNTFIEKADHEVNMIIDMTRSNLLPKNLMSHASSASRHAPDNIGKTVFVGANAVLRTFFNMFKQVSGIVNPKQEMEYYMVPTLEKAYAIVRPKSERA